MRKITIKKTIIGENNPKICVPVMGTTVQEIVEKTKEALKYPVDIIEWRSDFFKDVLNIDSDIEVLSLMQDIVGDVPILFTFRSKGEGGEKDIDADQYTALLSDIISSEEVDMIDVEYLMGVDAVKTLVVQAHNRYIPVMGSSHDFKGTPSVEDIYSRLVGMKVAGMDISKMAVMPNCHMDVIKLLEATCMIKEKNPDILAVTMSMGEMGAISRIAGHLFGSVMTFASAGVSSAPGQLEVTQLRAILDNINTNLSK